MGECVLPYPKGKIQEMTIDSKELGEEMEILVYLPADFSPFCQYSLLIAQDGKDYFQFGRIARVVDEYLYEGEIENLIIAGIPYKNIADRRRKYHPDGEQHHAYIRFLAHELVPLLDQEYPTFQMGSTRALIGDSLGATVSLMTALHYPHTFGKALLQSPFVNDYVLKAVQSFAKPELLEIYHVAGNEETAVNETDGTISNFIIPNRKLSKVFTERHFRYFYDEFDGGHLWKFWQPDIRRAVKKMFHL